MSDSEKKYICHYVGCGAAFNRPYRLTQHLLFHSNFKAYACLEPNCDKTYTSKSHLIRHINSFHKTPEEGVILYNCPTCFKKYANRQNLKRHIKLHHEKKHPLTCDICNVEFRGKNNLSEHMYRHTGIKSFRCEVCSNEYVTYHELKRHKRCHKNFDCNKCVANFNQWSVYLKHLREDHIVDEYICNDCGRKFKQRNHIVRHVKIHEGTKTYHCPYTNCERFYSRNSNLKQHILIKHEKVTHDCKICLAKLCTKAKLEEHVMRLHGANPRQKKPPKTRATGRKPRKDIGISRVPVALKLAGLSNGFQGSSDFDLDPPNVECHVELKVQNSKLEYPDSDATMCNNNETINKYSDPQYCNENIKQFECTISVKEENIECCDSSNGEPDYMHEYTKDQQQSESVTEYVTNPESVSVQESINDYLTDAMQKYTRDRDLEKMQKYTKDQTQNVPEFTKVQQSESLVEYSKNQESDCILTQEDSISLISNVMQIADDIKIM